MIGSALRCKENSNIQCTLRQAVVFVSWKSANCANFIFNYLFIYDAQCAHLQSHWSREKSQKITVIEVRYSDVLETILRIRRPRSTTIIFCNCCQLNMDDLPPIHERDDHRQLCTLYSLMIFDKETLASINGKLKYLDYIHKNGCP